MFGLGLPELVIILVIVILIFGASRLGDIGSGLGKAIRGFKDSMAGKDAIDVTPKKGSERSESERFAANPISPSRI
jgi:sec-independent protein translocase protein TatA